MSGWRWWTRWTLPAPVVPPARCTRLDLLDLSIHTHRVHTLAGYGYSLTPLDLLEHAPTSSCRLSGAAPNYVVFCSRGSLCPEPPGPQLQPEAASCALTPLTSCSASRMLRCSAPHTPRRAAARRSKRGSAASSLPCRCSTRVALAQRQHQGYLSLCSLLYTVTLFAHALHAPSHFLR